MGDLHDKRIVRFILVGFANAAISFGILNLCFYYLGIGKIISSIIATFCALIFSFSMNRNYVFLDRTKSIPRQAIPFVIVTVSGSLLVLNLIYIVSLAVVGHYAVSLIHGLSILTGIKVSKSFLQINLSTIIGAIAAMVWNYNGYRWFVFETKKSDHGSVYDSETI